MMGRRVSNSEGEKMKAVTWREGGESDALYLYCMLSAVLGTR